MIQVLKQDSKSTINDFLAYFQRKEENEQSQPHVKQKPVQIFVEELKFHMLQAIEGKRQQFISYITSITQKIKGKRQQPEDIIVVSYLEMVYNQRLDILLAAQFYASAEEDLFEIAKYEINNVFCNLTEEERHKYQEAKNYELARKRQRGKYSSQLYTMEGMLKLDIMLLFLLKNYTYQHRLLLENCITPRIIMRIFQISNDDLKRLRKAFEVSMNLLDYRYMAIFDNIITLFFIVQLRHRIYILHKYRRQKQFACVLEPKKILPYVVERYSKQSRQSIKFQFCQLAMGYSKIRSFSNIRKSKKQSVIKEIRDIVTNSMPVKINLLKIRQKILIPLNAILQLYEIILENPNLRVNINKQQQLKLYQDVEFYKWIFLTKLATIKYKQKNIFFYRKQQQIVKYRPEVMMITKMAKERYKLLAQVTSTLTQVMAYLQIPLIYISRFEYSYSQIKGITSQKRTDDLVSTHIIAVRQSKICLSTVKNCRMDGDRFKDFLIQFLQKRPQDKACHLIIHELQHNKTDIWDPLAKTIYKIKSKFGISMLLANSPDCFKLHFKISFWTRWLLEKNADIITKDNFYRMFGQIHKKVIRAFQCYQQLRTHLLYSKDYKQKANNGDLSKLD